MTAATLMLICCAVAGLHIAVAQEPAVLAQDLKKLRAPGKVASVLWTRRPDQYTLQIVFPRNSRMISTAQKKSDPAIQAWLLRADGTLIPAARRTVSISGHSPGAAPDEVLYSVPLPAGHEAVAVALMIDNDYYIEQLKPFSNGRT